MYITRSHKFLFICAYSLISRIPTLTPLSITYAFLFRQSHSFSAHLPLLSLFITYTLSHNYILPRLLFYLPPTLHFLMHIFSHFFLTNIFSSTSLFETHSYSLIFFFVSFSSTLLHFLLSDPLALFRYFFSLIFSFLSLPNTPSLLYQ